MWQQNTLFFYTMTVQLEYINYLLQIFKNVSHYAKIMLNAFSDLLCSKVCWHNQLVPICVAFAVYIAVRTDILEAIAKFG